MCRSLFIVLLSAISFSLPLTGQRTVTVDYSITYSFEFVTDTVTGLRSKPYDFLLLRAVDESRFLASNRQYNDSITEVIRNKYPDAERSGNSPDVKAAGEAAVAEFLQWMKPQNVDYRVVKEHARQVTKIELSPQLPPLHLEQPMNYSWKICMDRDTIAGLPCLQATLAYGGRHYTAWFSPNIPIPDGPYVFGGLPGLIVEISDDRDWYRFRLKDFYLKPHERFWSDNYLSPVSRAVDRQTFVEQSIEKKNNPRIKGAIDVPEEVQLRRRDAYQKLYHLLIEWH